MGTARVAFYGAIAMGFLSGSFATAIAQNHGFSPRSPGREVRHDAWNNDRAPRPPAIWRGHGGKRWTNHYHTCRKTYGDRYDHRSDMVRQGRNGHRCKL